MAEPPHLLLRDQIPETDFSIDAISQEVTRKSVTTNLPSGKYAIRLNGRHLRYAEVERRHGFRCVSCLFAEATPAGLDTPATTCSKRFGNTGDPLQNLGVAGFCRLAHQALTDPQKREAVHKLVMISDGLNRVLVLGQYGQWDLVSQGLAKIVEDNPDDALAHCNLGLAPQVQGKIDEGIAAFREAIRLKPDFDEVHEP
jgi:tetratricopeptide (TPR) repeat protein